MSSLEKCLSSSLAHFLIRLFIFLVLSCMSCLYILEINPLLATSLANIFCHSVGFLFHFVISFALQSLLFSKALFVYLFIFLLFLLPWEIDLRKHWYNLCQNILPVSSSRSFTV